jgi:hypothetical protein
MGRPDDGQRRVPRRALPSGCGYVVAWRCPKEVRSLWGVEDRFGRVPRSDRRAERHEFPNFVRALALVVADLRRTWPSPTDLPELHLIAQPGAYGEIGVNVATGDNSAWHGNPVTVRRYPDGHPGGDPVAVVADSAQETITERLGVVWPLCPIHGFGLHVGGLLDIYEDDDEPSSGPGAWWCTGDGGHLVAEVGLLGMTP